MESIADLFGRFRTLLPKGKVLNERAELINFFVKATGRTPQRVGVRLAHYTLSDLYALKSAYSDRLARNGAAAANKYWWWCTKTTQI
jgi:hypothetical protein